MKSLKITVALAATVLMTSPASALPGHAPSSSGAHGNNGERNGSSDGGSTQGQDQNHSGQPVQPGHSHRCSPHGIAYVASGMLLSQTLSRDGSANTYSGDVEVAVKHANRHAAPDRKTTKTYKVEHVHITFALADVNHDGSVGLGDVQANDRVTLIGKISSLSANCNRTGFTPTVAIAHIVLHPPAHP